MVWPKVETNDFTRPRPLKYKTGAEVAKSVVVYSSAVTLDSNARRLVPGGSLLCKITSGLGIGKYGPYSKTASDGRESIDLGAAVFTELGYDVVLGDRAVEGLFSNCVFDMSELTPNGASLHGATLTSLKAAFPNSIFDD